ncbi:hypothetical protein [Polaribacter sp. IC073]|uniref:hypothetical protein n=1 Tax=Polaribacter sp. IC073 TaxID=2508540 RepID=UPI0011BDBA96|nr:hypothetical protein [Polaribacter sp. IC073]TXD48403.1 hypothetical protein ES045_08240 [Polaribacter sp. IC073]
MKLEWTRKEFEAYVLLYAAHCNRIEDIAEQNYIRTKINEKTFHKMHTEVVLDCEEEKLHKIQHYVSLNNFSQEEKEGLLRAVKQVFFADGSVDTLEKNLYKILKKIID